MTVTPTTTQKRYAPPVTPTPDELFDIAPCALCNHEGDDPLIRVDLTAGAELTGYDLTKIYPLPGIAICNRCYHVYLQPMPKPAFLQTYHAQQLARMTDGFRRQAFDARLPVSVERRFKNWLKIMGELHPQGRTLLDIGSGVGTFLRVARCTDYLVAGLEPHPEATRHLQEALEIPIHCCLLRDVEGHEKYDLITAWGLLNCVANPFAALHRLRRLLKPDGLLVTDVPLAQGFSHWAARAMWTFSCGFISKPVQSLYSIDNLHYFNGRSIQRLLRKCGFDVRRMYTYQRRIESQGRFFERQRWGVLFCSPAGQGLN